MIGALIYLSIFSAAMLLAWRRSKISFRLWLLDYCRGIQRNLDAILIVIFCLAFFMSNNILKPAERLTSQVVCGSVLALIIAVQWRKKRSADWIKLQSQRRWQGKCVTCGYDLRQSPSRCPECGAIVARIVILHNDDVNQFADVVEILKTIAHMNQATATHVAVMANSAGQHPIIETDADHAAQVGKELEARGLRISISSFPEWVPLHAAGFSAAVDTRSTTT